MAFYSPKCRANETDEIKVNVIDSYGKRHIRPVKFSARYVNRSPLFSHRRYVRTRFKSVHGPDLQVESREKRVIHARARDRASDRTIILRGFSERISKRDRVHMYMCVYIMWVEGTSNPNTVVALYNRERNDA